MTESTLRPTLEHRKWFWKVWDTALGLHSNIPECCVRFMVDHSFPEIAQVNRRRQEILNTLQEADRRPSYVPCEACLTELVAGTLAPNPVHRCNDEDPVCRVFRHPNQDMMDAFFPAPKRTGETDASAHAEHVDQ